MKVEFWIDGILVEGQITKKKLPELYNVLTNVKHYSIPNREFDFKIGEIEYYTNEGLAFHIWKYLNRVSITAYDVFYNKKRDQIGLREVQKNKTKKITRYQNEKITKKYLSIMADNVILLDMEEPKDFGKVPKRS